MLTTLLVILGAMVAGVALALILYVLYSHRPATLWKRRVQVALAAWEARKQGLTHPTDTSPEARDLALRGEYFARHLRSISVDHLLSYSGIGPVTVYRLRDAGYADLDALARGNFSSVPGLGSARVGDLSQALQQAKRAAKSQFDAGACPAAVAMLAEKKSQKAERTLQYEAARQDLQEVEAALAYLAEPRQVADEIGFLQFLARRPVAGLNEKLLARSLSPPPFLRVAKPAPVEPVPAKAISVPQRASMDESPLERLRAVAAFGYAVAKVDGRIAAGERRQIRVFLERRYASTADLRARIDEIVKEIESNVPALNRAIAELRRTIPTPALAELYQFAISVLDASGQRNSREDQCLARIAESLGIQLESSKIDAAARPEASDTWTELDCRTVLEISQHTPLSGELIRRQYHVLSDRFALSKFSNHGAEFVTMAGEKRTRIERAAKQLLVGLNEPLEAPVPAQPTELRHNPDLDAVFG